MLTPQCTSPRRKAATAYRDIELTAERKSDFKYRRPYDRAALTHLPIGLHRFLLETVSRTRSRRAGPQNGRVSLARAVGSHRRRYYVSKPSYWNRQNERTECGLVHDISSGALQTLLGELPRRIDAEQKSSCFTRTGRCDVVRRLRCLLVSQSRYWRRTCLTLR